MKLILKTLVTGAIGLPTVMWHGMGDHAESNAMHHIKKMILGKFFDSMVWVRDLTVGFFTGYFILSFENFFNHLK